MQQRSNLTTFAVIGAAVVAACLLLLATLGDRALPGSGSGSGSGADGRVRPVVAGEAAAPDGTPVGSTVPTPGSTTAPATDSGTGAGPGTGAAPTTPTTPAVPRPAADPNVRMTVDVPQAMTIRATPGGAAIGTLPANSPYYGTPVKAWVQAVSADGRWGKVSLPWTSNARRTGWVRVDGLHATSTNVIVRASVSHRRIVVSRAGKVLFTAPAAVGRPGSATPTGSYYVTDLVDLGTSHPAYGTFVFGLSGVQTHLPSGWSGGNQLAIHGTNRPSSIGTRASAGCLRVSEQTLRRLRPLLRLGTPVVISG